MPNWTSSPEQAWLEHILPPARTDQRWIEDSDDISDDIKLSKRELFGLIIMAHIYSHGGEAWEVGYDTSDGEPNDGYITDGTRKVRPEHKVVTQMEPREVLRAIEETYADNAKKGKAYGKGRILVIQPNKGSDHGGLVRVSDLRNAIGDSCPFDQVLLLHAVSKKGDTLIMHVSQHYPVADATGMAQVDFDTSTGSATVPHCAIDMLKS